MERSTATDAHAINSATTDGQPAALGNADRIGVLGDTHGDMNHLLTVCRSMRAHGVSILVVLGDFGFVWPRQNWSRELDKINSRLEKGNQVLHFVDGNHEMFPVLHRFPIGGDGLRWLRPRVAHIPRGFRAALVSGRCMAALGGANSVDFEDRVPGESVWPEESITDDDLAALGQEHADVLFSHDAPLHVPTLERHLAANAPTWSKAGIEYANAGQQKYFQGFLQCTPRLSVSGHYHLHVDETVTYDQGGTPFETRVVALDMGGSDRAISQAIVDVATLNIEYLRRDGSPIDGC